MNPESTCFCDNETIRRQKLIPAAKFLQTLTRDSEMMRIFRFFPAWGVSSGMEYSTLTSCCFTPVQLSYVWKISMKDSPTSFMIFVTSKSLDWNAAWPRYLQGRLAVLRCHFYPAFFSESRLEGWLSIPVRANIKRYGWKKQVCCTCLSFPFCIASGSQRMLCPHLKNNVCVFLPLSFNYF